MKVRVEVRPGKKNEGVTVNGIPWRDLPAGKRILYAIVIPLAIIIGVVFAIFGLGLALGILTIAIPIVLGAAILACVIGGVVLLIGLPIALIKHGKKSDVIEVDAE